MNKKEVAEALGITTRQVETYASKGRLGEVKYVRGRTGKQADYDAEAVAVFKAELDNPDHPITALQAANSQPSGLIAAVNSDRLITTLEALGFTRDHGNTRQPSPTIADLAAKPLLTLAEAHTLTGLSRGILREAIDAGKLKARIIGRAWRIKRDDLNAFIKKL
jgi:excisionase family DNA binding protein